MNRLLRTLSVVYWIAGMVFLAYVLISTFKNEYSGLLGLPCGSVWVLIVLGVVAAGVLMILAGLYNILIGLLQEIIGIDISARPDHLPAGRRTSQPSSESSLASWFGPRTEQQDGQPHKGRNESSELFNWRRQSP